MNMPTEHHVDTVSDAQGMAPFDRFADMVPEVSGHHLAERQLAGMQRGFHVRILFV